MTPLVHVLADDFTPAVRQRGARYYRDGRVSVLLGAATEIAATVRGTRTYAVKLRRAGDEVQASCSCPYFDVYMCKHIWAVLLAADAQALLQGEGRRPYLVHDVDAGHAAAEWSAVGHGDKRPASLPVHRKPSSEGGRGKPPPPNWRVQLDRIDPLASGPPSFAPEWPEGRELLYVIDAAASRAGAVCLDVLCRDRKKDGGWGKPKQRHLPANILQHLPDARDRQILASLVGAREWYPDLDYAYSTHHDYGTIPHRVRLRDAQADMLLPLLCATSRCRLRLDSLETASSWKPVTWREEERWRFELELRRAQRGETYELVGRLVHGDRRIDLDAPALLTRGGSLLTSGGEVGRYDHRGAFNWVVLLREQRAIDVPVSQGEEFVAELLGKPALPPIDLPDDLRYEERRCTPRPRLAVEQPKESWRRDRLRGELTFDYDGTVVAYREPPLGDIVQRGERRVLLRDSGAERAAVEQLHALGWRAAPGTGPSESSPEAFEIAAGRLPSVVQALTSAGWRVEAEGITYRSPSRSELSIGWGIDWFELHGKVEFGDTAAELPELLAAARHGERMVKLGDGTFGLLPEEWLERYRVLAGLGTLAGDGLRFTRGQVALIDALLAAEPQVRCDEQFAQAREALRSFGGVAAEEPPAGFRGELRPYQKESLGWFAFLRRFGFGGCLADDMGLGKTVQVLALLERRRELRRAHAATAGPGETGDAAVAHPSLVVVPRSLVFNWKQEAARFAPNLRVLDHTGTQRRKGHEHFADYDVVLTTYGTLRSDAVTFKQALFDYVILDEAQAIKNASSLSAKAVRLLRGSHRLALSGTPVENHLGELWSLFEFLNPGMLGAASVFKLAGAGARMPDEATRQVLAEALRPFLLRRTKDQVIRDLPPKVEQTLYCELDNKQRKVYGELRDHYRRALLARIDRDGINTSKIQILEALLRLRQAAIHPGLIDEARADEPSAKLDILVPRLLEVAEEGHKALVFSQFTSMLAILQQHLRREGVDYAYIDGKTVNRQACVERFQTDPGCRLLLISLKAGGVGLNLTAAQYVFLLDPWWNPAVEMQAIDRAHRIGQRNRVFAYRLIARDTIEEKVLELQEAKRGLADAIVGANNALIRKLTRRDLELLLS